MFLMCCLQLNKTKLSLVVLLQGYYCVYKCFNDWPNSRQVELTSWTCQWLQSEAESGTDMWTHWTLEIHMDDMKKYKKS